VLLTGFVEIVNFGLKNKHGKTMNRYFSRLTVSLLLWIIL